MTGNNISYDTVKKNKTLFESLQPKDKDHSENN